MTLRMKNGWRLTSPHAGDRTPKTGTLARLVEDDVLPLLDGLGDDIKSRDGADLESKLAEALDNLDCLKDKLETVIDAMVEGWEEGHEGSGRLPEESEQPEEIKLLRTLVKLELDRAVAAIDDAMNEGQRLTDEFFGESYISDIEVDLRWRLAMGDS